MTDARPNGAAEEAEIRTFLSSPSLLGGGCTDIFETHCALVFVGASEALKIKRRVRYPYLDFSTLDRRKTACERELEVNRRAAPEIYLGVTAITREAGGGLALGGNGPVVEWAVRMRRFDQADILSERIAAGPLTVPLLEDLADTIARYHAGAPPVPGASMHATLARVTDEITEETARFPALFDSAVVAAWRERAESSLDRIAPLLARRAEAGFVRRCHGDLHLANIVLWRARPLLFDAIEFDEDLATIDTLYDLAFLLMDLDRRGQRGAANLVMNRYLWRTRHDLDLEGLSALPLMMSLRAGIRAFVTASRAALENEPKRSADQQRASASFELASAYLTPHRPALIAIAGLSGTGKSTLAAALAPSIGPAPGALHLRTDLERKALFGVEETATLPPETYTPAASAEVYALLMRRAAAALAAGWPIVIDSVALHAGERRAMADLARRHGAAFHGFWLEAPLPVLQARVTARSRDASDATAAVVAAQAAALRDAVEWTSIDASGPPHTALEQVRTHLGTLALSTPPAPH